MAFGLSAGAISAIGAVAGPVVSGLMGGNSASQAADAQSKAASEANATQRYMFDTTRADNAPFLNNGVAGNNKLAHLLGLNPSGGFGGQSMQTAQQLRNQLLPKYSSQMSQANGLAGGNTNALMAQILASQTQGAPTGLAGSQYANQWQFAGPDSGLAPGTLAGFGSNTGSQIDEAGLQAEIDRMLAEQERNQAAQQQQAQNDPAFGSLLRKFSMSDLQSDVPYQVGMQFGLDEGTKALNRMAAARGGLNSGGQAKALTRFGNDYGSTKANEAYNRFTNDQTGIYNKLAGISGTGQTASSQVGAAGQNYANQVSQNQLGVGNARASSYIAGANALGGGITGAYNNYQSQNMFNRLMERDPYSQMSNYGGNSGIWNGGSGPMGWVSGNDLNR